MSKSGVVEHADSMAVGALAGMMFANRFLENDDININKESTAAGAIIAGGAILGAMLGYWNDSDIYNKAFADGDRYDARKTNRNLAYSIFLGALGGAEATRDCWPEIKQGGILTEDELKKAAVVGVCVVEAMVRLWKSSL